MDCPCYAQGKVQSGNADIDWQCVQAIRLASYDGMKWAYRRVRLPLFPSTFFVVQNGKAACMLSMHFGSRGLVGSLKAKPLALSYAQMQSICRQPAVSEDAQKLGGLVEFIQGRAPPVLACAQAMGQESVPPHMTAIFGAVAALASSSASFPLEIVRRRAMMGTAPAAGARVPVLATAYSGNGLFWHNTACHPCNPPSHAVPVVLLQCAQASAWLPWPSD
jgi:hypothetical protein